MRNQKCEPGCTCKRHSRKFKTCEPGCTCKRHVQTEEHKRKNSESLKGYKKSTEHLENLKRSRREGAGWVPSLETREKIRQAHKERFDSGQPGSRFVDGRSKHPQYQRWYNMMDRCHWSPIEAYGLRGIVVCKAWHDPLAFYDYLENTLGPCPEGYSLDRIDNDGNYEPGNVRWATWSQQNSNQQRSHLK